MFRRMMGAHQMERFPVAHNHTPFGYTAFEFLLNLKKDLGIFVFRREIRTQTQLLLVKRLVCGSSDQHIIGGVKIDIQQTINLFIDTILVKGHVILQKIHNFPILLIVQ